MKTKLISILIALSAVGCSDEQFPLENRCGGPGVAVYPNTGLDFLFGDYDKQLASGEINSFVDWGTNRIWLISNGRLNVGGGTIELSNCLLIQSASEYDVIFSQDAIGGSSAFLPDPDAEHFYSLNQGQMYNGRLELIVSRWKRTGAGRLDCAHEVSLVYDISPAGWVVERVKEIEANPSLLFGSSLLSDDGYSYIYATRNVLLNRDALVARVRGSWMNEWEYYNGYLWTLIAEDIAPIFSGVSDYFSVFKTQGGEYYAVSHGALLSQEIQLFTGYAPEKGWQLKKTLYCTSEVISANSIVLDTTDESLTCVYNVLGTSLDNLSGDAPVFIDVNHWNY